MYRQSKKNGVSGSSSRALVDVRRPAESAHRDLKRMRPPVRTKRDDLAVENQLAGRQRADELDDFRHRVGDVTQGPREHADLVAGLVHLNARAIQLVLQRGVVQTVERRVDVAAESASIGSTGRMS